MQEDALKCQTETKQKIWNIKIEWEKALTELLIEEINQRIKCVHELHLAKLELVKLEK